jgi:GNAT superfamily N-acetyltransferase
MTDKFPQDRVSRLPIPPFRNRGKPAQRVPRGKLEMIITYLEMNNPPQKTHVLHRGEKLALMRAENPTISFYRYLYNTVGGPWLWHERRLLDDDALREIIHDPEVEIFVLHVAGVPAGFAELDLRQDDEVELAYFGLVSEYIGRGLGHHFLDWAVDEAWRKRRSRVWVHTCNLDHPAAIAVYQRAGFVPYEQEHRIVDDPRKRGFMPKGQEF